MRRFFFGSIFSALNQKTKLLWPPFSKIIGWIPLTPRSLLLIPLLVWIRQVYGISRNDFILLVLADGGFLFLGVSILMVTITALILRFRSKIFLGESYQIETELTFKTDFKLKKIDWIPWVNLQIRWKTPLGVFSRFTPIRGELVEEIIPTERGIENKILRQLEIIDLLGLAKISFEESERRSIKVSPRLGKFQSDLFFKQFGSGDFISHPLGEPMGDRVDLRRYARGDPLKHILWKIYARTRKLMVREIELAISPAHKTYLYLIASSQDEAVASLVRTALEKRIFGNNFVFLADGEKNPTSDFKESLEQIIRSVRARTESAVGLADFTSQAKAEGINSCVVFASGESFEWIDSFFDSLQKSRTEVYLILVTQSFSPGFSKSFIRPFIFESSLHQKKQVRVLKNVFEKLLKEGVRVSLIDSISGRSVFPGMSS